MLVYEGIKSGFINDVDLGIIADKIRNKYIEVVKRRPSAPRTLMTRGMKGCYVYCTNKELCDHLKKVRD